MPASFATKRLIFGGMGMVFLAFFASSCRPRERDMDVDVTAKTTVAGIVNGSPIEVDVLATFNTGRGGSSTCTFTKLPAGFNPASLGTHM